MRVVRSPGSVEAVTVIGVEQPGHRSTPEERPCSLATSNRYFLPHPPQVTIIGSPRAPARRRLPGTRGADEALTLAPGARAVIFASSRSRSAAMERASLSSPRETAVA